MLLLSTQTFMTVGKHGGNVYEINMCLSVNVKGLNCTGKNCIEKLITCKSNVSLVRIGHHVVCCILVYVYFYYKVSFIIIDQKHRIFYLNSFFSFLSFLWWNVSFFTMNHDDLLCNLCLLCSVAESVKPSSNNTTKKI